MIAYDPKNWLRVVFQWEGSVIPRILPRILLASGLGVVAAALFVTTGLKLPPLAHTLLGVALGLLLVFRTNASYDRYWEGRKLLGMLTNRSRDLARQAAAYITGEDAGARAARAELQRLNVVFFALLRQHLRGDRDLDALGAPITADERAALADVPVRPVLAVHWMTQRLAACLAEGRLSEQRLQLMDTNLTVIVDSWGGAERILRTPVPFAYAQHIKAFLSLFCFSAPFAMVEMMRWYTPIAAAILAFGMLGIDEIGVEIEDPFGDDPNDLPVDAIEKRIAEDTAVVLAARDGADAVQKAA